MRAFTTGPTDQIKQALALGVSRHHIELLLAPTYVGRSLWEGDVFLIAGEVIRWRMRELLNKLPSTAVREVREIRSMGYLFSGTYGDFVQCLDTLHFLAAWKPEAEFFVAAPRKYLVDFDTRLPASVRFTTYGELLARVARGQGRCDVLLTNAVGVYRVRFEMLARVVGKISAGFSYPSERPRSSYHVCQSLPKGDCNFSDENLKLARAVARAAGGMVPRWAEPAIPRKMPTTEAGPLLFHVGSSGTFRRLGLQPYLRLVHSILMGLLKAGMPVTVIHGPQDEEVASYVKSTFPEVPIGFHKMERLFQTVEAHRGPVLCFDSFMGHLCHHLIRPAYVVFLGAIPYGYNCSRIHRQVVLAPRGEFDPAALFRQMGI